MFVIVDHGSNEVWYDAARRMDRFAAADLLREVCSERFGSVDRAVASGLALRYDGGSCFRSDHYQTEIDHLGIARSPAFHYEPETNGCAEKALQTLKEQLLWIERFNTLDELRTGRPRLRANLQPALADRAGRQEPKLGRLDSEHLPTMRTGYELRERGWAAPEGAARGRCCLAVQTDGDGEQAACGDASEQVLA